MKEINEDVVYNGQLKVQTDKGEEVGVNNGVRPYKVYSALLSQTGANAPVATILENTIGDIVWTRSDVGRFIATLSNAFTQNKTFPFCSTPFDISTPNNYRITVNRTSVNTVQLEVFDPIAESYAEISDTLAIGGSASIIPIEIRVYP